jgi:hypothetical protein
LEWLLALAGPDGRPGGVAWDGMAHESRTMADKTRVGITDDFSERIMTSSPELGSFLGCGP